MARYERLSAQDAAFLYAESPTTHMHVGALAIFEGGGLDERALCDHVEARLHLVPRFRKKLMWVPHAQGRPVWVDDPHFDIRFHMRHVSLPDPGGLPDAYRLMERVMSAPLDRARPLWEMWAFSLPDDRFGIIHKTHHCLVDGVAGVDLGMLLMDAVPEPPARPEPPPWRPSPLPTAEQLVRDAWRDRVTQPLEIARSLRERHDTPEQLLRRAGDLLEGMVAFGRATFERAPEVASLTRPIGAQRRFLPVRASLSDVKAIKNAHRCTVNDVVLAVVAGGLRRLLMGRGEPVDELTLKALVPVSVRDRSRHAAYGNQVSMMAAELPVGEPEPLRRLTYVCAQMEGLKASKQSAGAHVWVKLAELAPPIVLALAARAIGRQRMANLAVSNVPGPPFSLYLHGGKMLEVFPFVPLVGTASLGVAILSYDGKLCFGVCGDWDLAPDLEVFAAGIEQSLGELR